MKRIKLTIKIALALLIVSIISFLIIGGFAVLFSIAFGILLCYYLVLLGIAHFFRKKKNQTVIFMMWILILVPIIWAILDYEHLFNFILQWIRLDMK